MKILTKIMLLGMMSLSFSIQHENLPNPTNSNGDYGLSCTNTAYGAQNGLVYPSW